jgi:hypothetical protein
MINLTDTSRSIINTIVRDIALINGESTTLITTIQF